MTGTSAAFNVSRQYSQTNSTYTFSIPITRTLAAVTNATGTVQAPWGGTFGPLSNSGGSVSWLNKRYLGFSMSPTIFATNTTALSSQLPLSLLWSDSTYNSSFGPAANGITTNGSYLFYLYPSTLTPIGQVCLGNNAASCDFNWTAPFSTSSPDLNIQSSTCLGGAGQPITYKVLRVGPIDNSGNAADFFGAKP